MPSGLLRGLTCGAGCLELAPHRVQGWLNRRDDEQFWAQAAAVCKVYLRPPPGTVVICIDEKTGILAKYRRYPERAARPGRLARREFEYVRNGTVSIIAALYVATGQVVAEPIGRNDPATFTSFLHLLDQGTDPRLNIYLIMDNGSSHTSQFRCPLRPHRPPVHLDLRRRRRPCSPSRPPRQARRFRNPQAGPGQRPPSGRTAPTEAAAEACQGLMRCCIRAAASSRARGRRPPWWP
jgi:DDE superfamily endonuclease